MLSVIENSQEYDDKNIDEDHVSNNIQENKDKVLDKSSEE